MNSRNRVVSGWIVFVVLFSMGMASQPACAGTATGYVVVDDERVEFTYAYATVEPNWEDETQEDVVVMLTDQPFTDEAVVNEWRRADLMEEKGIKYVKIFITPDQEIELGLEARFDPSGPYSYTSLPGSRATLELKVFNETHVEGRYYAEPSSDADYDFDLTFQAEIQRPEPSESAEEAEMETVSPEEPEAETTADSPENDEELAALSPEEKYARTVEDMRSLGEQVFAYHQIDLNHFPICPSEKDLPDIGFGKSEWGSASWEDYKDFYDGNFKDAWGTPFKYVSTDDGGEYTLTSYGADQAKGDGGGKFDADIVYSNGMFVTPVIEIEIEEPESEPKTPQEKFDRTVEDMRSLGTPIESYLIDFEHFPICPSEKDLRESGMGEIYHGDMVKDAWGTPFKYVSTDDGYEFTLTSYGADKAKGDGGGEFDADIVYTGKYDSAARSVERGFIAPPSLVQE